MKYLITGAAGFVGTNLTKTLLKMGENVVGVDSLVRPGSEHNLEYLNNNFPYFRFHRHKIEDVPRLIHKEKPNQIFHFAAQVAVTSSVENPLLDFRVNAEGTFGITQAAREIGAAVIYTSTNKVYGDNVNSLPISEMPSRYDFTGNMRGVGIAESFSIDSDRHTPYGVSKLVGELYVREFGGIANRCSCMYGLHQFGIVDQGWLSHFATNKIVGRPSTIYGNGKQVRDAVHINDVVDLLLRQSSALSRPESRVRGQAFNIGGGYSNTISLLELCERWQIRPTFANWRPADQKVFYSDIRKAEKEFGWRPQISLDEGLDDLFRWTARSAA